MPAHSTVLRVALPVPLPRLFDYLPPPGVEAASVEAGRRILVPFGNRELCGMVVGHGMAGIGVEAGIQIKPALALPDPAPLLQGELLGSLRWLAGYLHAPLGEVLATALPAVPRCRRCVRANRKRWRCCWTTCATRTGWMPNPRVGARRCVHCANAGWSSA